MAANPGLHVVEPGEKPPPPKRQQSLVEAVEAGDYLGILRAQRRDIAASLPDEKGPAKAALHRQLSIIAKEIEFIELGGERREAGSGGEVSDEAFDAKSI